MSLSRKRFPIPLDRVATACAPVQRPQRPVREASAGGMAAAPAGQGLDSAAVRQRMVERLRAQGVELESVLRAMGAVPRDRFVDTALVAQAYEDTSLPIGWEQTISKPVVVAKMISLLAQAPGVRQRAIRFPLGRVLEIGTGCGYQAAVLARLASRVTTIERLAPLAQKARIALQAVRCFDVRVLHADGRQGHPPSAPYDSIISAAGGMDVPQAWLDQLAEGGRLVAPLHDERAAGQVLTVIDRTAGGWVHATHDAVHFVPLKSGHL